MPLILECGLSNQENRIIGGRPTLPNKYPWVTRLVYDGRFHCGASLINNNYVITAAHCVRRYIFLFNKLINLLLAVARSV